MPKKIAYFINQYPMISHAFIRREMQALEAQGIEVQRISLRGWHGKLVDDEDLQERARTRYVLEGGLPGLCAAALRVAVTAPARFLSTLLYAVRLGWRSERPVVYHLVYLAEACQLMLWLRECGATHVHAHFGTNSAEIVMLCRRLGGAPYSFTVHGPKEFDSPQLLHLKEKITESAFVVAITSFTKSQLSRWVEHSHWDKIKVVRCGLDSAYFEDGPQTPSEAPRLVCLGRLVEQKGQLLLVEAAHRLRSQGLEFELVLIGDGEMRSEISALVERLGLQSSVRLTGALPTPQIRELFVDSRALVLPSFAEGLPMVIMEAMAMRRPVISTYIAGIPELIQPGRNGWLIPAGSVEALVEAMREALQMSPEALKEMGEQAYQDVRERHSATVEAAKLASLFTDEPVAQGVH